MHFTDIVDCVCCMYQRYSHITDHCNNGYKYLFENTL